MKQTSDLLEMDLPASGADWRPTPHGTFMAKLLAEHNLVHGKRVLELGAGVGIHTIIMLRQGAAELVATEIAAELLETTRANIERNCPDAAHIEYRVADWLNTTGQFDVIVTNPPFCKSGKQNRRYFIDALILDAHKRLVPGGQLIFVQSSMADVAKTERRLQENGYTVQQLGVTEGEFRDYYFEDDAFMDEIKRVPQGFEVRAGVHYEKLCVLVATLQEYVPPKGAHVV
jgi:methylase of polypeptide subunit release factors